MNAPVLPRLIVITDESLGEPALLLPVPVILFFIVLLFVLPALRLRRQWKRQEGPFGPYEVRVWEEGVEFIEQTSAAMIPWTAFSKLTQTDRVLLLHQDAPPVVRFIPRALFSSEEEWQALLRLVREKLPEK